MSWVVPANLCRKGERSYAHGTDILLSALHAVEGQAGEVSKVKASFHRMLLNDADLLVELNSACERTPSEATCAYVEGTAGGKPFYVDVVASSRELGPSYAYDEGLIAEETRLASQQAILEGQQHFSSMETLVAMTKLLHQAQVSSAHKWVWSRLDLSHPLPVRLGRASVRLTGVFGTRLTKSLLYDGEHRLGSIFFSCKDVT